MVGWHGGAWCAISSRITKFALGDNQGCDVVPDSWVGRSGVYVALLGSISGRVGHQDGVVGSNVEITASC